jgi:hypothetical protein
VLASESPSRPRPTHSNSHHPRPLVHRGFAPHSRSQPPRKSRRSAASCSRLRPTQPESWATCSCPERGKSFRQEISVPDHGARIKAVETLLREGLGRVGEAEVAEPRMPTTVAEVEALSWSEMKFIFAITYAQTIQAFADQGDEALRSELERWDPEARATIARALAEVA